MYIKEIFTKLNSFEIYSIFKDSINSFILDSGMDSDKLGRYSFIGSKPFLIFKSKGSSIEIKQNEKIQKKIGNPFDELNKLIKEYKRESSSEIPFTGGAVGYFGYDMCHHIEKLPNNAKADVDIPECSFGFYDGIIIIDHKENRKYIASHGIMEDSQVVVEMLEAEIKRNEQNIKLPEIENKYKDVDFQANMTKQEYLVAVEKVRNYIKEGDIYQANFTQRFSCKTSKGSYEIYNILRTINPAPFAAYINMGEMSVLSSSPERFIRIKNRNIETRPIKGTRPRGKTIEEDKKNREELLASEKDKAELLMIVDLERNDLGKISEAGTVRVTELFHLEEYATVYHLVSTIVGKIRDEYTELDAIKAAFPGGSITGAPKIRAMEIIDELEPTKRNIYTGSIGYIGFDGGVDLNIVIRTIFIENGSAYFQAGGAIVWDSDPEAEYEESLHKARAMMRALQYI